MRITFDPAKRDKTLQERGLDFADAPKVFFGSSATIADERFDYPEIRFITAAELDGRFVVVVWTPIEGGRRVISMRYGHDREVARWRRRMD